MQVHHQDINRLFITMTLVLFGALLGMGSLAMLLTPSMPQAHTSAIRA